MLLVLRVGELTDQVDGYKSAGQQHSKLGILCTWKELLAIVMSVHTWSIYWTKQQIAFRCDNQAVMDIWEKGTTRDSYIMALNIL